MSKLEGHIQVGLYMKPKVRDAARKAAARMGVPFYMFVEKAVARATKKATKKKPGVSDGRRAAAGKSAGADGNGAPAKSAAADAAPEGQAQD